MSVTTDLSIPSARSPWMTRARASILSGRGELDLSRLVLIVVVAAVLPPVVLGIGGSYALYTVGLGTTYAIAVLGSTLLTGFAGRVTLAQGAVLAAGAYTGMRLQLAGVPLVVAALAAALVGGVVNGLLSLAAARLSEIYTALTSLALAFSVPSLTLSIKSITNGDSGLGLSGSVNVLGFHVSSNGLAMSYIVTGAFALSAAAVMLYLRSPLGRLTIASAHSTAPVGSAGVSPQLLMTFVWVVAGFLGGGAGSLYATLVGYINGSNFDMNLSLYIFVATLAGGVRSITGSWVGGLLVACLPLILSTSTAGFTPIILGLILAVIAASGLEGIWPAVELVVLRAGRGLRQVAKTGRAS